MAGIYIHVPFCKQACSYCNFYFSTSTRFQADYVKALCKEITLQKYYLKDEKVSTIYLGGGTPSLLSTDELAIIFETLHQHFSIEKNVEITLEANPDDLDGKKLAALSKTPVNRLSIGIQSFNDNDLKMMNRAHNAQEAMSCIPNAQDIGFDNISIDLIYGLSDMNEKDWEKNLTQAEKFKVQHLSCYSLTIEENTALFHQIRKGKIATPKDSNSAAHFSILMDFAKANEWRHYEISNFCKKDYISQHNSAYWKRKKYLGLGPAAHSYNQKARQWNIANTKKYIDAVQEGKLLREEEILSPTEQMNEYIMTSLRTDWGLNLEFIQQNFADYFTQFEKHLSSIDKHLVIQKDNVITLSHNGKFYADIVASNLFVE
ncbi:MAG: radical SAM family heme chaperone HemW [Chitinophagales bacterium]